MTINGFIICNTSGEPQQFELPDDIQTGDVSIYGITVFTDLDDAIAVFNNLPSVYVNDTSNNTIRLVHIELGNVVAHQTKSNEEAQ